MGCCPCLRAWRGRQSSQSNMTETPSLGLEQNLVQRMLGEALGRPNPGEIYAAVAPDHGALVRCPSPDLIRNRGRSRSRSRCRSRSHSRSRSRSRSRSHSRERKQRERPERWAAAQARDCGPLDFLTYPLWVSPATFLNEAFLLSILEKRIAC